MMIAYSDANILTVAARRPSAEILANRPAICTGISGMITWRSTPETMF